MTALRELQYMGGPFADGTAPDDFIDRIDMRSPAGNGAYVLTRDEATGLRVYEWEPENGSQAAG
ncbi:hypothetical protein ACFVFT_38365 [Streptomyces tendae]|uniref:hypothetical protein n=1 Tax=Streptomyces tendae TaxID=1932 RepID=UPI00367C2D74